MMLLLLLLNFITDSLLHTCTGKYDSCPNYKHYIKTLVNGLLIHAMNIKQPPPVGTYS